ncbi:SEC-C metal-binding domain-containing protein [Fusibacter sp. JL216-2]|uniref:SEC-C metal-binding domain-containing protein n=1 Tax=Fusibacter sp. JL216-2 TaxID=3071453 RepID=UPI003D344B64
MSLFQEWESLASSEMDQQTYNNFWKGYLAAEQSVYESILEEKSTTLKGNYKELADKYSMDSKIFMGFLDGINTSLNEELDLESLTEESEIDVTIDFEKLFWNMLDCKAEWLYTLEQWDGIIEDEKRKEIKKEYNKSKIVVKGDKVGRNEPCPCGSGKKYKKCCLNK